MKTHTAFAALAVLLGILLCTSLSHAQVTATPFGLSAALNADEQTTQGVTLSNSTNRQIPFQVKFKSVDRNGRQQAPRRDDIGDVIEQYQIENGRWFVGIAWDGTEMWGYSHNDGDVISFNPANGQITDRWNAGFSGVTGMEYANDEVWIANRNDASIHRFDRDGNALESIRVPRDTPIDVAWDGEFIWYTCLNDDRTRLFQINMDSELQRTVQLPNGRWDGWASMEFVEEHPDGQMWMRDHGRSIYELNIEEDNAEVVQTLNLNAGNEFGLAHDGENLWYTLDDRDTWVVADDGVTEVRWLDVAPKEGEIARNGETDLEFTFNSAGMEAGFSEFWVDIEFPENEDYNLRMSAILTVGGGATAIHGVVTDAATGNVIQGAKASMDHFVIERSTDNQGAYQISNLPLANYNVTFTCPDYLTTTEAVQLGENGAELNVALLHSECNLSIEAVDMQLAPDAETEVNFSISNDGNGPLQFSAERKLIGDANAAPWDVRRNLDVGATVNDDRVEGVAFDGENFYFAGAAGADSSTIYIINRDGEQIGSFEQLTHTRYGMKDLEYDGENFWGSGEQNIFCFDTQGEEVANFRGPYNPTNAIGYDTDEDILWLSGTTTNIAGYDREGNALNRVLNRKGLRIYGLAYWPDDPDGYNLYIIDQPAGGGMFIHKMNTANGDTLLAYRFLDNENVSPGGTFICNTYDVYSWVLMTMQNIAPVAGGDRLSIIQLDARKDWFSIEPAEGTIDAGARQNFTMHLNTNDLPTVRFEGEILFTHDGVGGETRLPVSLDVVAGPVPSVRNISLDMGWNMISVNLQPDDAAFAVLTRPLVDAGVLRMVKDDRGHFMMVGGNQFNNLADWDVAEGYLFKVTEPATLRLEGMTVMADDMIHLDQGWQMISYYPRRAVSATVALSGIVDQLQVAKDGLGNFYIPAYGYENIGLMHEGLGYQVRVSDAVDLVYRTQGQGRDAVAYQSVQDHPGRYPLHPLTGSNMSLLVEAPGFDGEIGIYANGELVGTGRLDRGRAGAAVWGDDPSTPEIDGAVNGDALEIRLMDDHGERILSTAIVSTLTSTSTLTYQTDGFAVVRASEVSSPETFMLAGVYPNPFNGRTTARVVMPEAGKLQLALYDLGGRLIREVRAGHYEAGSHDVTIDAGDLASGVYLLRLSAAGKTSQMKVALLK